MFKWVNTVVMKTKKKIRTFIYSQKEGTLIIQEEEYITGKEPISDQVNTEAPLIQHPKENAFAKVQSEKSTDTAPIPKEDVLPSKNDAVRATVTTSFSNNHTFSSDAFGKNNWFIVSATAIGKSHLKTKTPCQDNHYCESINENWGIAICCDGAGSADNSELGSEHTVNTLCKYLKKQILKHKWITSNSLPTSKEWDFIAKEGFQASQESLIKLAKSKNIKASTLACTAIIVIYSPLGLLISHVGDGRAGYCNEKGEWKAMLIPHKGQEANQTVFITNGVWVDSDLKMSGVRVPESRVINEKPIAFTLLTDGCEHHSFECSLIDKETNKWFDPNMPYPKFFNPLLSNLKIMYEDNVTLKDANGKWREFIKSGTKGLESEPDDKTMILGILL